MNNEGILKTKIYSLSENVKKGEKSCREKIFTPYNILFELPRKWAYYKGSKSFTCRILGGLLLLRKFPRS